MAKKKSALAELDLAQHLREEANRKIAEAKKKVKEEEEKEALKIAKQLMKTYKTSNWEEIKEKIKAEVRQESSTSQSNISEDDLNYLKTTANELRSKPFVVNHKALSEEVKRRF